MGPGFESLRGHNCSTDLTRKKMQTTVIQGIGIQRYRYSQPIRTEENKTQQNHLPSFMKREEILGRIAFLTQYLEDLKAGKPVDNMSPSNDPFYLDPENIAQMLEDEKHLLKHGAKFRTINSIEDIIGEWDI